MFDQRLKVAVTRRLPDLIERRMEELFDVELRTEDIPMSHAELCEKVRNSDVLVSCITDKIDASVLGNAGSNFRLIANFGAGFDNIDVRTAIQKGILVSNTPGVVADDTADLVLALLLNVVRKIPQGLKEMQSGTWSGWSPTGFLGGRLLGRRLGIIGMGRIGSAVAVRAKAFGLQINYHNRKRLRAELEQNLNASFWESLDQMVAHMDVISINCPHTPSTFHLMNARRLNLMKPNSILLNTSRGEVVDENALARLLLKGAISGVGLDVYERGRNLNPNLLGLDNVVLLPHMGSATHESRLEMGEKVIINIKTFMDGHKPPDLIVPAML